MWFMKVVQKCKNKVRYLIKLSQAYVIPSAGIVEPEKANINLVGQLIKPIAKANCIVLCIWASRTICFAIIFVAVKKPGSRCILGQNGVNVWRSKDLLVLHKLHLPLLILKYTDPQASSKITEIEPALIKPVLRVLWYFWHFHGSFQNQGSPLYSIVNVGFGL